MKNKLKILLMSFFLFGSLALQAQDEVGEDEYKAPRATVQIRGGMNISNLLAYNNRRNNDYFYDYDNADAKIGYNIGVYFDVILKNRLYLHTGLAISSKGADIDEADISMNAVYAQVPLYFGAKIDLPNPNLKLKFAIGPYFAYGIGGKTSGQSDDAYGRSRRVSIDTFGGNDGLWNRFDFGLGLEASLEINNFVLSLGSETGITNAWNSKYVEDNFRVINQVIGLSVGYNFK